MDSVQIASTWGIVASCTLDLTVSPWGLLAPQHVPLPWQGLPWGENWVFWGEMLHTGRSGEKTASSLPTCTIKEVYSRKVKVNRLTLEQAESS